MILEVANSVVRLGFCEGGKLQPIRIFGHFRTSDVHYYASNTFKIRVLTIWSRYAINILVPSTHLRSQNRKSFKTGKLLKRIRCSDDGKRLPLVDLVGRAIASEVKVGRSLAISTIIIGFRKSYM